MSELAKIHNEIGKLPDELPKIYLLGSTGAGKTTIVRNILGTEDYNFPSVSQIRTTVAITEYVIDSDRPYKTTFIFKEEKEIKDSINEIVSAAVISLSKGLDSKEKIKNKLEETSDERFRLKYIIEDDFLSDIAEDIMQNDEIKQILTSIQQRERNLRTFIDFENVSGFNVIISSFVDKVFQEVKNKIKEISGIDYNRETLVYELKNDNKDEFLTANIKFLSSQKGSLSPLIKYARVEGNLLSDWIPKDFKFVLIDGEGIGHNLKDINSELSVRHLDFFNISDAILLIEKGDDPFVSGGNKACKSIVVNGYIDKLNIIFSKTDKIDIDSNDFDIDEVKKVLSKRIANLENALQSDENINFHISEESLYYLSQLNKTINENSKKQIVDLLQNIINQRKKNDNLEVDELQRAPLEYDFSLLLDNYDSDIFLKKWDKILNSEAWQTIKAFNKRMYWKDDEYKYLKPISDYHTLIMKAIDSFLIKPVINNLDSDEFEKIKNTTKQKLSKLLLQHIREVLLDNHSDNWQNAFYLSGIGSTQIRKEHIKKIFEKAIYVNFEKAIYVNRDIELFELLKNYFINDCGIKEISELENIVVDEVKIEKMWNKYNIQWLLNEKINILIGKNGTGKSTILKLIANPNILNEITTKSIYMNFTKKYKNSISQKINVYRKIEDINNIEKESLKYIIYIDTFDNKEQSDLNKNLKNLIYSENGFSAYIGKLEKIYDEKIQTIEKEIEEIINNGSEDDFNRLKKLNSEKKELHKKIYKFLNDFEEIINTLFSETKKSINLKDENYPIIFKISENESIEYHLLSSGEKQILILLLTVLLKNQAPIILILDEPEISLHVEWQAKLIDALITLNPNMQIIIATHSPALVSSGWSDKITKISDIITEN